MGPLNTAIIPLASLKEATIENMAIINDIITNAMIETRLKLKPMKNDTTLIHMDNMAEIVYNLNP